MEETAGLLGAARELMGRRHYAQAVSACREALCISPTSVDVRLLLAEALMALRRDAEAQAEVAASLRGQPRCPQAYRLLGELAFRRDELRAAEIFLREAIRLEPHHEGSHELLALVQSRKTPAAAAAKLPAASAAAGTSSLQPRRKRYPEAPLGTKPTAAPRPVRFAAGTEPPPLTSKRPAPAPVAARDDDLDIDVDDSEFDAFSTQEDDPLLEIVATVERPRPYVADAWLAKGTPHEGIPVAPEPAATEPAAPPIMTGAEAALAAAAEPIPLPLPPPPAPAAAAPAKPAKPPWRAPRTDPGEPTRVPGASRVESVALKLNSGHTGFGEYLVRSGALSREQLYWVLQVMDWKQIKLGEAALHLGYLSDKELATLLGRYRKTLDATSFDAREK